MPASKDITGMKKNMLTAVGFMKSVVYGGKKRRFYLFACDCGVLKEYCVDDFKSGQVKSCGCQRTPHGMSGTPEYIAWCNMIARCTNPEHPKYKDYGARGIAVYVGFIESFEEFYECVGERPSADYSLDRINNHGPYAPGNIRWSTTFEQNRNRRNT